MIALPDQTAEPLESISVFIAALPQTPHGVRQREEHSRGLQFLGHLSFCEVFVDEGPAIDHFGGLYNVFTTA